MKLCIRICINFSKFVKSTSTYIHNEIEEDRFFTIYFNLVQQDSSDKPSLIELLMCTKESEEGRSNLSKLCWF